MRILYDSKQPQFKTPFGTLTPGQVCTLHIHIPTSVLTTEVICVFNHEDGSWAQNAALLTLQMKKGAYDVFEGQFSIPCPGLFFYYFVIDTQGGSFRLFKQGDDTNMEAGDLWQLSCIPADFTTPDWAKGATIYQVFPDRFYASGQGRRDREAEALHHPRKLVRRSGLEAHPRWAGAEQRLFRRQFPGHHRENGLYCRSRRHHSLPEPHFQELFQPPLRHRRLQDPRPPSRHRGGFCRSLRRGPRPGHPGHSGRRVFPHRLQQPLLQPGGRVPIRGRVQFQGIPLLQLVHLLQLAERLPFLVGL